MASAPCISTTIFSRCAPGPRLTSPTHLPPSRVPTTWSLTTSTSWTTTARDRVLGMAPVMSTRRRRTTTTTACNWSYVQGRTKTTELSFNVTLPADYNHFRQKLVMRMREMLRDENNPIVVHEIARLPPQVDTPGLMNLTLLARQQSVTLSVRTDNLYVVGFRNGEGRWFEFRHDGGRRASMIQGSTVLQYSGAYTGSGIGDLSESDAILGRYAVENAIYGLSRYDGAYNDDVKLWLRTLIVNFIESVRFNNIAEQAAGQMRNLSEDIADRQLTEHNIQWIRNWGNLSEALMLAVDNPVPNYFRSFHSRGISELADVARVLGMALVTTTLSACNARRPRRGVDDSGATGGGGGLTLAEVVGVVIGNVNDQDPGKVYGTITVTDGFGALQLYNRDKDHYQEVGPGGKVDLAYPRRPISGADGFVIDVDLMDHYRFIIPDRKVALGQMPWNSLDALSGDYDRILKAQVTGEYGNVEVQYAVLTDAVVAAVEVVLVDSGNSVFSPDVYGSVTATTTMASGEPLQYSLLDKARDQHVEMTKKNTAIPLQRKLVSAPLYCSGLQVSADLWDANALESDDQIVNGSVVFTPRLAGTNTAEITGPRGKVRVVVTWSM